MDDDFDIYNDLDNIVEDSKLKKEELEEIQSQRSHIERLTQSLAEYQKKTHESEATIKILKYNITKIINTARIDMKRKDMRILDLTKEKDAIIFRRFGRNTYNKRPTNTVCTQTEEVVVNVILKKSHATQTDFRPKPTVVYKDKVIYRHVEVAPPTVFQPRFKEFNSLAAENLKKAEESDVVESLLQLSRSASRINPINHDPIEPIVQIDELIPNAVLVQSDQNSKKPEAVDECEMEVERLLSQREKILKELFNTETPSISPAPELPRNSICVIEETPPSPSENNNTEIFLKRGKRKSKSSMKTSPKKKILKMTLEDSLSSPVAAPLGTAAVNRSLLEHPPLDSANTLANVPLSSSLFKVIKNPLENSDSPFETSSYTPAKIPLKRKSVKLVDPINISMKNTSKIPVIDEEKISATNRLQSSFEAHPAEVQTRKPSKDQTKHPVKSTKASQKSNSLENLNNIPAKPVVDNSTKDIPSDTSLNAPLNNKLLSGNLWNTQIVPQENDSLKNLQNITAKTAVNNAADISSDTIVKAPFKNISSVTNSSNIPIKSILKKNASKSSKISSDDLFDVLKDARIKNNVTKSSSKKTLVETAKDNPKDISSKAPLRSSSTKINSSRRISNKKSLEAPPSKSSSIVPLKRSSLNISSSNSLSALIDVRKKSNSLTNISATISPDNRKDSSSSKESTCNTLSSENSLDVPQKNDSLQNGQNSPIITIPPDKMPSPLNSALTNVNPSSAITLETSRNTLPEVLLIMNSPLNNQVNSTQKSSPQVTSQSPINTTPIIAQHQATHFKTPEPKIPLKSTQETTPIIKTKEYSYKAEQQGDEVHIFITRNKKRKKIVKK